MFGLLLSLISVSLLVFLMEKKSINSSSDQLFNGVAGVCWYILGKDRTLLKSPVHHNLVLELSSLNTQFISIVF